MQILSEPRQIQFLDLRRLFYFMLLFSLIAIHAWLQFATCKKIQIVLLQID